MGFNSGSIMFLLILIGALTVLIIALVIVGLTSRKKKPNAFAKFIVVLLSIATTATFVTFPLSYYNVIDVNVRLGNYASTNNSDRLRIHRSSAEYSPTYNPNDSGKWTIENDILTIYFSSGVQVYEVKDFGTKLYQNGELVFKFINERADNR